MKKSISIVSRIGSLLLCAALLVSVQATVVADGLTGGDGAFVLQGAPLNEAYLSDGRDNGGIAPSPLDLSYLTDRYASLSRARAALPFSYDLRDEGIITPVGNQEPYGMCWTFGALGSAESGLIKNGASPYTSLSNLHLSWFNSMGPEEEEFNWYRYGGGTPDPFDGGGNDQLAVGTLAAWKGPVSAAQVPYTATTVDESQRYNADYHLQDAVYLSCGGFDNGSEVSAADTSVVKRILMENGAVSVSYTASDMENTMNPKTFAWYHDTYSPADHTVLIAGWDDSYSRNNFAASKRPAHDGAWLVRNSWGADWGNDGYFWLSYEDKTIDYGCFYQMETADNYQRNYQYDTMGWCNSMSASNPSDLKKDSNAAYIANVFTAQGDERLDAVAFYTTDVGTQYEITVYTGLSSTSVPTSGRAATATQAGTETYPGYHTIELNQPAALAAGETFSVVVKLTNPDYAYPIPVEICFLPPDKEEPAYMGNGGESYISQNGRRWEDAAGAAGEYDENTIYITNVCLKAFTNPLQSVSFSLPEGPVTWGSALTLTAPGTDAIYYTTDGSDPTLTGKQYTAPIPIDKGMTVKAAAKSGSRYGAVRSHVYTQAAAQLTSLQVKEGSTLSSVDLANENTANIRVARDTGSIRIQAQGRDTITVNGSPLASAAWLEIPLSDNNKTTITIRSEGDGKSPVEVTLSVYRSVLTYDYAAETVRFDETQYTLRDTSGQVIHSGDSISPYIVETGDSILTVRDAHGSYEEYVPNRPVTGQTAIDYENECTLALCGDWNMVGHLPDMSDAVQWNGTVIPLTPGQNVYIQRFATDTSFRSNVWELVVPARPDPPASPGVDYKAETTRDAVPSTLLYGYTPNMSDGQAGENLPVAIRPGQTLYLQTAATEAAFASAITVLAVPERPAAPAAPLLVDAGDTKVTLAAVAGGEYRLEDGAWQGSPVFDGLVPGTAYTVWVRLAATDTAPASEARSAVIFTAGRRAGDISGDGLVTAQDALMALQAATRKIILTPEQSACADVDGKDGVTPADALMILQFTTKKISGF